MMSQNLLSSNQSDVPFYMTTDTDPPYFKKSMIGDGEFEE